MAVVFSSVSYDREKAISALTGKEYAYQVSQMYRYHNTFPRPDGIPQWPELLPPMPREAIESMRENGSAIGTPEDALKTFKRWEEVGVDGVLVTPPPNHYAALETLELVSRHVIPEIDKDPTHRTSHFRANAK